MANRASVVLPRTTFTAASTRGSAVSFASAASNMGPRSVSRNPQALVTSQRTFGQRQNSSVPHATPSALSAFSCRSVSPAEVSRPWTGNPRLQVQPRHTFVPGLIIRTILAEEAVDKTLISGAASGILTPSIVDIGPDSPPLCVKFRYCIVIAVHVDSYTCIPLFTHNGRGLLNKSPQAQEEFVSVQDHRISPSGSQGTSKQKGKRRSLMTGDMYGGRLSELSTAWLVYPVARRLSMPVIVEGTLDHWSVKRLFQYLKEYAPTEPVGDAGPSTPGGSAAGRQLAGRMANLRVGAGSRLGR